MSRLFNAGGETGSYQTEGIVGSDGTTAPSFDSTTKRISGKSLKLTSVAGDGTPPYVYWSFSGVLGRTYYARAFVYFTSFSVNGFPIGLAIGNGGIGLVTVWLNASNQLALYNLVGGDTQIGSPSSALSLNTWYLVELACKVDSGNSDYAELRVNGVSIASSSSLALSDSALDVMYFGNRNVPGSGTLTYYGDDIALNDNQGSSQNSWVGNSHLVFALPISDNARSANWLNGGGGTTNLYDAVDNEPPVGVASGSSTSTSQVKNSASDTSGNYDANLQTYATLGVASQDKINLVQALANCGCSSATSTSGALQLTSNPAEGSETSLNFSSGGIAGTFPSNWVNRVNAMIYNPSITLGSSPVLRIGKRQATTRVGMVDLMGIWVDYTPKVEQTLLGKALIQKIVDQTQLGKARIQKTADQTQAGLARIQKKVDQTLAGKSRVQKLVDSTIMGLGRVQKLVDQTVAGLARIAATANQSLTGKARVTEKSERTQTGISRIQKVVDRTLAGLSRIQQVLDQTIAGLARIQARADQTVDGRARITAKADQTQLGRARITATTDRGLFGRARVQRLYEQVISGLARIASPTGVDQEILGAARITARSDQTQTGLARIQKEIDGDIAGISRIQALTDFALTGMGRIRRGFEQVLDGIARITAQTDRAVLGRANLRSSTRQALAGRAFILSPLVLDTVVVEMTAAIRRRKEFDVER